MLKLSGSPIPKVALVRRHFLQDHIADVAAETRKRLAEARLSDLVRPGWRIAITAGSRGIAGIDVIVGTVAEELRRLGAQPFVIPAMGSHGGATAAGQVELLAELGITEARLGVPILSSMETVVVGRCRNGAEVHMDRHAFESDGVVVINRVKCHTNFRGPIESGLCKMLSVGLGKQAGAESIHGHSLASTIPEAAQIALETGKVLLGIAVVENAYHQPYRVVAVGPRGFHEADRELLILSNKLAPGLPFDELDVLVVDWIGKEISGSGMDSNVIGQWRLTGEPPFRPMYRRVVALNVTPGSHGNCVGIGMADFTTRRLVSQFDAEKVYLNALTANVPHTAKIPMVLETEVEAVEVALRSARPRGGDFELVRIKSTSELQELYVTAPLLSQLAERGEDFELVRGLGPMPANGRGELLWG